jgi:regulator of sigma E protease
VEMASFNWVGLWAEWFWPILQFVIGLGLVIFVHEFGHFTVAKAVGIRVEQFALGFGPRLFGFKGGETDYRVNLLPLGGYVKMTGQEDFGPLREQDEPDPRSYSNKPVSARFAVISAGVIMNVILAGLLFIIVCLAGIRFPAPVVGGSLMGYPAHLTEIHWQTIEPKAAPRAIPGPAQTAPPSPPLPEVSFGLQPGYRILEVDGQEITRFSQLAALATLADPNQKFKMTLERVMAGKKQIGVTQIGVMPLEGHLAFGLMPALSTTLGGLGDYMADDPFKEGDRIVSINGRKIEHHWEIARAEEGLSGRAVPVTLLRGAKKVETRIYPTLRIDQGLFFQKDGTPIKGEVVNYIYQSGFVTLKLPDGQERKLSLEEVTWPARDEILDILGLVPRLQVAGVIKGSPADAAGLKPGDIIEVYGNRQMPTMKEFVEVNRQQAGTGTRMVVIRDDRRLPPFEIYPTRHKGRSVVGILVSPDEMDTVAAHVRPGSPAVKTGLRPGDAVTKVNGRRCETWLDLFRALKAVQGRRLTLSFHRGPLPEQAAEMGLLRPTLFDPKDYRFILFPGPRGFTILMGKEVKKNPLAAIPWGARETWSFITMTYATLVDTLRGTVSYKEFSGPVGIGSVAIQAGRQGVTDLIYLMAIISVSLAVLNSLPLPVVDGGYAVFLLIEKVRGKPLPLRVQNTIAMAGWALLIVFFVLLTWNDIMRILNNLW